MCRVEHKNVHGIVHVIFERKKKKIKADTLCCSLKALLEGRHSLPNGKRVNELLAIDMRSQEVAVESRLIGAKFNTGASEESADAKRKF